MVSNSVWRRPLLVSLIALAMSARAQDPAPLDAAALAALGIDQEVPTAPAAAAPPKVQPNDGSWDWSAGPYKYDGAGNIIGIGTQSFTYDVRGRLVGATMTRSDQPGSQQFTYSYDVMGNMVSRTAVTSTAIPTPTSAATNHLTGNGAAYDAAGNLTSIQPPGQPFTYAHTYDALNTLQKTHVTASPVTARYYVYTADGERLWTHDAATNSNRWTLRDLSGKVLRDYTLDWVGEQPRWRLSRDYVYRDGLLLAAITPTETLHFSLDHLGSVRVVTDANKQRVGLHYYLPFGEEWLVEPQATDSEPMKFTGHERDSDLASGTADMDYMHARYYMGGVGRFLSVDPARSSVSPSNPQTWNRYSYALNNPIVYTDPTGKAPYKGGTYDPAKLLQEVAFLEEAGMSKRAIFNKISKDHAGETERYFYTERYGWVDIRHFGAFASAAALWPDPLVSFVGGVEEVRQWVSEWGNDYRSGLSPEDGPSNDAGVDFGDAYLTSKMSATEALRQWLEKSGALPPQDPRTGYENLPDKDPSKREPDPEKRWWQFWR